MKQQSMKRIAGAVFAVSIATVGIAACSENDSSSGSASSSSAAESGAASGAESGAATGAESPGANGQGATAEVDADGGAKVTLHGPIAAKYQGATEKQRADLGKAKSGAGATNGADSNGVIFQQFDGGVITSKSAEDSATAYITWGKIRDAWNVKRDAEGQPSAEGKGGSAGPLGVPTSDETDENGLKVSSFDHGKITFDAKSNAVQVTVNDKVVPSK